MPIQPQPIPQGPAPSLNRAWPRRGWANPPPFGASVTGLMMETTITVTRTTAAANSIGGFNYTDAPVTVYQGPAHVEHVESLGAPLGPTDTVQALGTTVFHHYELFGPMPADPDAIPRRGDVVSFSDGYEIHTLPIIHVEFNAGLTDHWEAWTDEFEA